MQVRIDAVGNVIGRYEARPGWRNRASSLGPGLMMGSHFDSVRNGQV